MLKKVRVEESRRSARKKLFLRGFVQISRGKSPIDCLVRDFSEVGAKLRFRCTPLIPDFFELHIPATGTVLQSKLIWMKNCEAGVSFDPSAAVGAEPSGYIEVITRVSTIENDVARLKNILKQLQRRIDNVS